ncbi:MAG: TatD family hydrolase [Candidatus Omnitrophota bacterium]|nr:TatD family hydrolase [Candidatus Omnitrophota bacterium]
MMLIDTHCHLDFPEFDKDRAEVIRRAKIKGIDYIINIGSSLEGSERSLELSGRYEGVYATVGIHPHEADRFDKQAEDAIRKLAAEKKVVGIGETGLDYYKNFSRKQNQLSLFISLIGIAKEAGLPLVIHSRQAPEDTLKILKKEMPLKGVVHCFSGDEDFLKRCLDLNFFVSFTCNITYKKADNLKKLVTLAPLQRLLLETDAPYLAPQEFRGKRNEPAYLNLLAEEIARIKGVKKEEVAAVTSENAIRFFNLR